MITSALDTFGTALARGACAAAQLLRRTAQWPRSRARRSAQPSLSMPLGIVIWLATTGAALAEAVQDAAGAGVGRTPPAAHPIDAMRPAFIHGGASHGAVWLLTLGVSAALCALIRVTRKSRAHGAVRRGVALLLSALLLSAFGAEQWSEWRGGSWSPAESLPLHLCDLGLAVTVAALLLTAWRRADAADEASAPGAAAGVSWAHRCGEMAYFWGLGGTLQALLTPDVQHDFPAPECVRFFAAHAGIVVGVLVLTFGLGLAPAPGALRRAWWTTMALMAIVYGLNWIVDGNYMYLRRRPARPSLIDWLGPYPFAVLGLIAVGSIILGLLYLPWWLARQFQRREHERAIF